MLRGFFGRAVAFSFVMNPANDSDWKISTRACNLEKSVSTHEIRTIAPTVGEYWKCCAPMIISPIGLVRNVP